MRFFNDMKKTIKTTVNTNINKFKNKPFAEAVMAACALVVVADGNTESGKRRVSDVIMSNDRLSSFDPSELKRQFEFYNGKLKDDFMLGRIDCFSPIVRFKGSGEEQLIVQLAMEIAKADNAMCTKEDDVIKEICMILGLSV